MSIRLNVKHSGLDTVSFLERLRHHDYVSMLNKYGDRGVEALSKATPYRTGKTADSWRYEIHKTEHGARIIWVNDNVNNERVIAVLLQYGHGTRNGSYVQGIDYINPALRPVFESIADDAWTEVINE